MPRQSFDFHEDYDEYIENTPLEARFDYQTIQIIVSEGFEKHRAYGMTFEEYRTQRTMLSGYDDSAKKRLSFYLPPFYARIAADLALINNSSFHGFMIMMIELGLIHFQVDYHDEYITIRDGRTQLFNGLSSEAGYNRYMQLEKQTINLGSCVGAKMGKAKHFVPNVHEWLYNASSEISNYLNMPISDLIFLSFCMSVENCMDGSILPREVSRNTKIVCDNFDYEIKAYSKRISDLLTT